MSDPFIGEIRMFGGNFAPTGWATCDGQLLPINQNQALFSLLATNYGGNGITNFALPDLRARVPIGRGQGFGLTSRSVGQVGGAESVALVEAQLPAHTHRPVARGGPGDRSTPTIGWAETGGELYAKPPKNSMNAAAIAPTGQSSPHENRAPYLSLTYIIALVGVFPPRP